MTTTKESEVSIWEFTGRYITIEATSREQAEAIAWATLDKHALRSDRIIVHT